jgi:hypothetical protein
MEKKAYEDGRVARDSLVRRSLNPYGMTGSESAEWFAGHDDRSDEIESEIDAEVYNRTVAQDHL